MYLRIVAIFYFVFILFYFFLDFVMYCIKLVLTVALNFI